MPTALSTSQLTLARELWRFGEDDVWPTILTLNVAEMVDLNERASDIYARQPVADMRLIQAHIWAAIERVHGVGRLPVRARRRAKSKMPADLLATEGELWDALRPVQSEELRRIVNRRPR
jgi:hypothetical protein